MFLKTKINMHLKQREATLLKGCFSWEIIYLPYQVSTNILSVGLTFQANILF
jgi:hypothetical protein